MKMKSFIVAVFAILAAFASCLVGVAGAPTGESPYQSREFAVSPYAAYQASGDVVGDSKWGGGIQADAFFTKNLGVSFTTSKNGDGGAFFQNLTVGPVLRFPVKQSGFAPYVLGGIGFAFDRGNDRYYFAGGGVEYRLGGAGARSHVSVFTDAQYQWRDSLDEATVARAGLRWTF
jgi:hypothetical protein